MALMTQFCACCRITVPQYGHRALAFTSSGAPQHSKQSENSLQSGILSPIFFYAGYPLSIIYFAPAHGKSDFPFRRTLEHKAAPPGTRPDGAASYTNMRCPCIFIPLHQMHLLNPSLHRHLLFHKVF